MPIGHALPRVGSTQSRDVRLQGILERPNIVLGFWGVRYQVKDVARAVAFYTQQLGLEWISKGSLPSLTFQSAATS